MPARPELPRPRPGRPMWRVQPAIACVIVIQTWCRTPPYVVWFLRELFIAPPAEGRVRRAGREASVAGIIGSGVDSFNPVDDWRANDLNGRSKVPFRPRPQQYSDGLRPPVEGGLGVQ